MSKNDLHNLFSQAKQEPDLISEDEMNNLLSSNNQSFLPAKDSIFQKIMGAPIMFKYSVAVAFAAITGFVGLQFTDTDEEFVIADNIQTSETVVEEENKQIEEASTEAKPNEEVEKKKVKIYKVMIKDNKISEEIIEKPNPTKIKKIKKDDIFKPVDIKGIQFVRLGESHLKELGINTENKELRYWNNWGNIDKDAVICTLYVNGGLGINPNDEIDKKTIPNPGISPRLITDNKGNRRVFVNDNDNRVVLESLYEKAKTLENKMKVVTKKVTNRDLMKLSDDKTHEVRTDVKIELADLYETTSGLNIDSLIDLDSKMIINMNYDSLVNLDPKIVIKKLNLTDVKDRAKDLGMEVNVLRPVFYDSLKLKTGQGFPIDFDNENVDEEVRKIILNLGEGDITPEALSKLKIDSINGHVQAIIEKIDSDIDTQVSVIVNDNEDIIKNLEEIAPIHEITDNIDEYIKVNKLIPILIPFGEVESDNELIDTEDFGFVLWYDPTPELLEVLPEDIQEKIKNELKDFDELGNICNPKAIAGKEPYLEVWRSCSGAIEKLNVAPNPAVDKIIVKFNLAEKRITTISIHDMFGNALEELQPNVINDIGQHEFVFDIHKYESGMYLISVQTDIGEAAVQRIVIER